MSYCNSELYNDLILNLSPETVITEKNNKEISKNVFAMPYRPSDVPFGARTLVAGDFVTFHVAAERATGRLRATKINILPKLGRILTPAEPSASGELEDILTKEFFDFEGGTVFQLNFSKNGVNDKDFR